MPKRTRTSGESVDGPLRDAMVEAFNEALDENEDLGLSLAIAFETGNAILRSRSSEMTLAEQIVAAVASRHGLDMLVLYRQSRSSHICHPRFIAWWLIRKHVGMSYPAIGQVFRGFHHSTVIHGCQLVEASAKLMAEAVTVEQILFPAGAGDIVDGGTATKG